MSLPLKPAAAAVAALVGTGALCPLCDVGTPSAAAQPIAMAQPAGEMAITRLHISDMTCGSCQVTARLALQRLPGVAAASVRLEDGLGVVHYDSKRVTPAQIAAHLTRLTGFEARILAEPARAGS